jgi:WD40 repeat protein
LSSSAPAPGPPTGADARRGPYQGLIPYTEADAAWFFGRETAAAVVLDNLLAYRVSIVFGTSGVGKSSLLRAGVVREIRDDAGRRVARGEPPEYLALHFSSWAEDPLGGLQHAIGAALGDLSPQLAEGLPEHGSLADTVAAAALRVDGALLVILDQFEEYFLYHDADGPFITQLARLLARRDTAASVLIAIREDSLAKLDALAAYMPGLLDNLVRIEHLDREAARAAILEPLALWNRGRVSTGEVVEIEPALVEAVLDGVQNEESRIQTPYLQIVLTRLWDGERDGGSRVLRLSTLERLGGAERIVAEHVDNQIATLSPDEQAIAASVLRQLVTPSGSKIALRAADLAEYAGHSEPVVTAVLERLTREARILQAQGGGRYEISHDALARPILEWRGRWQAAQDRLRERRRNRIVAAVATGLVLTVVVVATLAVLAWQGKRNADREAHNARAVALASASGTQAMTKPDIALLLGLAGLQESDRFETRSSLITARRAAGPEAAVGIIRAHTETVHGAAFLQGGRTIVSAAEDGRIIVSDVATHRQVGRPFASDPGLSFLALAVSRDERFLAAADAAGVIRLWEIASRRLLRSVATRGEGVRALAYSRDGRMLASADKSPIVLRNVPALTRAGRSLPTPDKLTYRLAFSPDGRTLASVGGDYRVRRWSTRTRRRLPGSFGSPRVPLVSVAFSPDGRTLATAGRRVTLWSVGTRRARAMLARSDDPKPRDTINDVVFTGDGKRLVGVADDGLTRVWDVRTRKAVRPPMSGPTDRLEGIALSPDGRTVASFGADGRVWLLDSARSQTLRPIDPVEDIAFGRSGRTVATLTDAGEITFWNTRSGRPVRSSQIDADASISVFSPDASTLATAAYNGRVATWNLQGPKAVATRLPGGADEDFDAALAFSPSTDLLAASNQDTSITLWDVARHRATGDPLRGRGSMIEAIAFSTDGRTLASADAVGVRLWDLAARGGPAVTRVFRQADVGVLAFSPDGDTLASGDGSGTIRLTRVTSNGTRGRLRAGRYPVLDMAFTPDGDMLIAGDPTGVVKIWDVAERRQLGTPFENAHTVLNHVAVGRDGRTFAVDGAGAQVRLWSHVIWRDEDDLSRDICKLVGADLSRAEWEEYAPGIEPHAICDR